MTRSDRSPVPNHISLHRQSKILEISFDEGSRFELPCEYLRVFSPSAEVRVAESRGEVVMGKENVNITHIEPVGNYAVRLAFDDGHDTGVYSWDTLYELGRDYQTNWKNYLKRRHALEGQRASNQATHGKSHSLTLSVLYFERLVDALGHETEDLTLDSQPPDVRALLSKLRSRDPALATVLAENAVKVTVNKQFASPETRLQDGDEVAIVPIRPLG